MKFNIATAFTDIEHLCSIAETAEECGYDGVAVSDHVVHPENIRSPYPYTPDGQPRWQPSAPWADPIVAIAAMAASTERIRFVTSVFVLPMRNPFLVAKAVGTAQILSQGRVILGIGMGWMKDEFELLGQNFHDRGRRADEMVEVLRTLWSEGMVEYHGEFYDFERLAMTPAPRTRVPIFVGGFSAPALRRVARLADGWISDSHSEKEITEIVGRIATLRREAGREGLPFEVFGACTDIGDLDGYRRLEDAGITHMTAMPWLKAGSPDPPLEEKRDALRRFADEFVSKLA